MPRAQRDLARIHSFLGGFRDAPPPDAAEIWYRGLREAIRSLRNSPNRCPATPENGELRQLLYGKRPHLYRIIYRILERQKLVDVLHIRHGAREEFGTDPLA